MWGKGTKWLGSNTFLGTGACAHHHGVFGLLPSCVWMRTTILFEKRVTARLCGPAVLSAGKDPSPTGFFDGFPAAMYAEVAINVQRFRTNGGDAVFECTRDP